MKIKPEHYAHLKAEIQKHSGGMYTAEQLKAARPGIRDAERARRHYAISWCGLSCWIGENIYPYANDDHLDTALRAIFKELQL
jgi:hypothetical protein